MNIAERILQNRFSITGEFPNGDQPQSTPPPPPAPPGPPPALITNQPVPPSYRSPQHQPAMHQLSSNPPLQQRSVSQNGMHPNNHFAIKHSAPSRATHTNTRPQSAKFKRNKMHKNHAKMPLTPPVHPTNYNYKPVSPPSIQQPPVPPIPIQQSYTPPSYSPNSPYTHNNYQINANPLNPSSPNHVPVNTKLRPNRSNNNNNNNNAQQRQFLSVNNRSKNKKNKNNELPMGWAKLQDEEGIYYFNVVTGVKQRYRPQHDAAPEIVENNNNDAQQIQPQPPQLNGHKAHNNLSVSDVMSVAERQYRKHNGSMIFANILQMSASSNEELIRQENWDMLVDAIYLNLSPQDYFQVFKALRSIAENLFDEDDKYRILYADNKKVQHRILSRIGGYEFLRGLGFRECSQRKLICDTPDFDIVATAISSINAKLSQLERNQGLPIIPNHLLEAAAAPQAQYDYDVDESIELDINIDEYLRTKPINIFPLKPHPNHKEHGGNLLPSPHHQGLQENLNKQFKQKYRNSTSSQYHPPPQHNNNGSNDSNDIAAPEIIELKLDPVISDVMKTDPMDEEDEKRSHVMIETDAMDLKEGDEGYVEREMSVDRKKRKCIIVEHRPPKPIEARERKASKVTTVYYSDEEDEKLNVVISSNLETDAGFTETEEYFKKRRDKMQSRKRSLSWSKRKTVKIEKKKKQIRVDNNNKNNNNKNNNDKNNNNRNKAHYKHRHTLPPKKASNILNASMNDVITEKDKERRKRNRRLGRKKALTHENVTRAHAIQRSSSVTSPQSNKRGNFEVKEIEQEVNRAFIDSERKLTLQALEMNEDEDIESLFDDDDDDNDDDIDDDDDDYKQYKRDAVRQQSRDDLEMNTMTETEEESSSRSKTWKRNFHFGLNGYNTNYMGHNYGRNTFSEGNLTKMLNDGMNRSQSDQRTKNGGKQPLPNPRLSQHLSMSPTCSGIKRKRTQKVRSNSIGDSLLQNKQQQEAQPMSILLPDEKKKFKRKQNKKIAKQKTAQKIRKSVGAIWNTFTSKKSKHDTYINGALSPKHIKHKEKKKDKDKAEDEDDEEDIMTANILNEANRRHMQLNINSKNTDQERVELFFEEDDTKVVVDADVNINSVNLICLSLEKRGWSSNMCHLFKLSIKDDDPNNSDIEMIANLEDHEFPIKSLPQIVQHLGMTNPQFIVSYKATDD